MPIIRLVRAAPLTTFAILACFFGWVLIGADLLGAGIDGEQLPLGPLIAAAIVAGLLGPSEWRKWLRSLATARTSTFWYAVALLAPVAIIAAAVLVNAALGAPLPTSGELSAWGGLTAEFIFIFLFIGIGEEAGWTAFALPRLLERYSDLKAWLILGAIRVLWHLPLLVSGDLSLTLGVAGNLAFQFIIIWLFRRSGGVWLLAALWHTVLNTVGGSFAFQMVEGADQERLGLLMVAGYWLMVLAILVLSAPSRRGAPR